MPTDLDYYNPEMSGLFAALATRFAQTGKLDPAEFNLILDLKAPRARTRHVHRLAKEAGGSFAAAVSQIAADLRDAKEPQQRLERLMSKWHFLLPTASAILAVLYPETFTVYDARACDELCACGKDDFHKLCYWQWSSCLWTEYQRFTDAVWAAAPLGLSLCNCDRTLLGRNKRRQMDSEIGLPIT